MLLPGNRRQVFHWEKYRRSAGDSCIANEPPKNAHWNTPFVARMLNVLSILSPVYTGPKQHGRLCRLSTKSTVLNSTLSPQCVSGFRGFTTMRYINRLFTYLVTYLHRHASVNRCLSQPAWTTTTKRRD